MNPADSPRWTVKQAAQYACVHEQTIKKWIRLGQLPAMRINSRVIRLNPEDVKRIVGG